MFLANDLPEKFSFEKEYLEQYSIHNRIFGFKQDRFFLDIGIPEDLARAQTDIIAYDSRMDQSN
jgi:D-glycero-alpha-D-manno-heptose 1-phosphate guanylyltransferase